MGTRSLTVFIDESGQEICVMYRQFDGYPEGHGKELADFLKNKTIVNGIQLDVNRFTIFNGMGCLTASTIAYFKEDVGGIYIYPAGTRNRWEDFTYIVSGQVGSEANIEILEEDFNGPASTFDKWLNGKDIE